MVLYGATKAPLTRYLEGLDHRYRRQGLEVICVKPGFVETSMTAGLDPPPFAGTPDRVRARRPPSDRWRVTRRLQSGGLALGVLLIRHLPRFVMRRVGF